MGENFAWNGEQCDWPVAATVYDLVPHYNNHSDSNSNQNSTGNEHQRQRRLPTAQNARADN